MRLAARAQIGVLSGTNRRNPFAMYLAEILEIEGFCYQLVDAPDRAFDLLLVPDIALTAAQQEAVIAFAKAGGSLLGLRPARELRPLFGLKSVSDAPAFVWSDRYLRLRDETVLQFHGPADLLEAAGADVLARLQPEYEAAPGPYPAVVRYQDGGRRAAFTFDLARAVVLFHQGRADQASDGPNPDPDGDGMFKPNDLFFNYLDPRCRHIPQADVLQDLFVELLDWLTEQTAPLPRLWHFPHAQPALAFLNGDSDSASPADLELAFTTAEQYGNRYTLYLMTEGFKTLPPEQARALTQRGHEIALHPWHSLTPTVAEFRAHLTAEYAGFREHYGTIPATVRNHCIIFPGWVDTPAIYRDIGVRMELNVYPARGFQSGFQSGTSLPVKLMRQTGQLLDFYQQATQTADDTMLTGKCDLPAHTIDSAIAYSIGLLDDLTRKYHGVYQPCFHPIHLRSTHLKTLPWYEAIHEAVRARNLRSVNGREWCDFNDARRTAQLERREADWQLRAERPIQGLTLLWPERVQGVCVNGQPCVLQRVAWGGVAAKAMTVDVDPSKVLTLAARTNNL